MRDEGQCTLCQHDEVLLVLFRGLATVSISSGKLGPLRKPEAKMTNIGITLGSIHEREGTLIIGLSPVILLVRDLFFIKKA